MDWEDEIVCMTELLQNVTMDGEDEIICMTDEFLPKSNVKETEPTSDKIDVEQEEIEKQET